MESSHRKPTMIEGLWGFAVVCLLMVGSVVRGQDLLLPVESVDSEVPIPDISISNPTLPLIGPEEKLSSALQEVAAKEGEGAAPDSAKKLKEQIEKLSKKVEKLEESEKKKKDEAGKFPTGRFTMQIQADAAFFGQNQLNQQTVGDIPDGAGFRRARIGWEGKWLQTDYRIEMDFALAGRPSFLDNWVRINEVPILKHVQIGHFFEPIFLERLTPNRFLTFLERTTVDSAFAPARNLGIMAYDAPFEQRMTWATGIFRADSDVFGDDTGDRGEWATTSRITGLLWRDDKVNPAHYMHVGTGYSFRGTNNGVARFRSQPEVRIGATVPNVPNFVDTGNIPANSYQLIDFEAAIVHGPFSIQSEYMYVPVDQMGGGYLWFQGYYTQISYFLTGEHRPYRSDRGFFDRVSPKRDFRLASGKPGPGAWEIATRISHLDLNNQEVLGGELTDLSVGLNWYWTKYLRFQVNYIRAYLDDPRLGASGADIVAMRVGYDF
ncbi:porin [bacterium]|nr:porin [bacterium]